MAFQVVDGVRRDLPRNEAKVRIRGISRVAHQVVAGHVIEQGEFEVEVYKSQVKDFEALTQTEEDREVLVQAEKRLEKLNAAFVKKHRKPADRSPHSIEACFRELTIDRDLPPFEAIEVLDGKRQREAATG